MNIETIQHIRSVADHARNLIRRNRSILKSVKEYVDYQTTLQAKTIQKFDEAACKAAFADALAARTKKGFETLCEKAFNEADKRLNEDMVSRKKAYFIRRAATEGVTLNEEEADRIIIAQGGYMAFSLSVCLEAAKAEKAQPSTTETKEYAVNIPAAGSLTEAKVEYRRALVSYEYACTRLDNAADAPAEYQERLLAEFETAYEELDKASRTLFERARASAKCADPTVEKLFNAAIHEGNLPDSIRERLVSWCLKLEA